MSDDGLSPKVGLRKDSISPFSFSPERPTVPPLPLDETLRKFAIQEPILDPGTPKSLKHQIAEQEMITGDAAQVMKRHMDAVIKVFAVHSRPNYELPWQTRQQSNSKSTGFAVEVGGKNRWILTNAHSVTYASQVQLKRRGDDESFEARVVAVGTECDVAILTVDDDEFWTDIIPLKLSHDIPELQQSVAVLGYPLGGTSLSVSAGVVSRVQMSHYSHGCMSLLAIQTDAAINSGNSGGPVLNAKGRCIGIAFQSLTGDTQGIGYVIPSSVVRHFVDDVLHNGSYTGFPSLNIGWQELTSKALKKAYGLGPHHKGILVRKVHPATAEAEVLKVDDIILKINGVEVGADGSVPFRHGERVDFKYIITNSFVGDTVELEVMRKGEPDTLKATVALEEYRHLVPPHNKERKPSYLVVGGLVFTACSDPYLIQRYGSLSSSPVRLMQKSYFGIKDRPDHEAVVLSNILACSATMGYDSTLGIRDSAVVAFNGEPVWSLLHLASMVRKCSDDYLRFDMEAANKVIILEREVANACTATVMKDHNIASEMSVDLSQALFGMIA